MPIPPYATVVSAVTALLCWAAAVGTAAAGETASAWVQGHQSRVRLIGDASGYAGIQIELQPGWKTYWRMPGDSGVPPNFDWSGSQNVTSATVLYPAPVRMPDQGGAAIGYKGSVVFPVRVVPIDPARPATLALAMEYGICRDICVPSEARLTLELAPAGPEAKPSANESAVAAALRRVPRDSSARTKVDPEILAVAADFAAAAPAITVRVRGASDVFVEAPDGVFVPLTTAPPANDPKTGASIFTVDLRKAPDFRDLAGKTLRITATGAAGAVETTWTVP